MLYSICHRLAGRGLVASLVITALLVPLAMSHYIVLDRERVADELDSGAGYAQTVNAVCDRVESAPMLRKLSNTSLAMNRQDIRQAVESALERATVARFIESVYRQTMERVLAASDDEITVDLTGVRRQVLRGIRERLLGILHGLPDCDVSADIATVWGAIEGAITDDSGSDILAGMPRCRPVGPVRDRIEKAIGKRTRALQREQTMALEPVEERGVVVVVFRWVDAWASGWWLLPWAVLVGSLAAGAVWSRRSRGEPYAPSVRRGLLVLGIVWLVVAALIVWLTTPIFRMTASRPESADIGAPLVSALATAGAWRLAALGVAALAIAGAMYRWMRGG